MAARKARPMVAGNETALPLPPCGHCGGVAYDTIRRATALLRDRGLIITIVGRGTYVTPEDQRP
jgi:hypothetical protein